jgi:hypothetical protein
VAASSALPTGLTVRKGDAEALARALEVARPVSLAAEHVLPVASALEGLLPWAGLARGATIAVRGAAARSLAFALVSKAVGDGAWIAVVGVPSLGLASAAGFGIPLERVVVVEPSNAPDWISAIGTAIDSFDVVLATGTRSADLRRFQPRARERGTVLVILDTPEPVGVSAGAAGRAREPLSSDVSIDASIVRWYGLHAEAGHLAARQVALVASGRRGAARRIRRRLWLPDHDGAIRVVPDDIVHLPGSGSVGSGSAGSGSVGWGRA